MILNDSPYLLPIEPAKYNETELHKLLVHLSRAGASDIKINSNNYIHVKVQGQVHRASRRQLPPQEVELILSTIYGPNGPSIIKDGRDIDKSYELHPNRNERFRFRINVVGGSSKGQQGIEITARTIKITPPSLSSMNVEQGILDGIFPQDGIVLVVGPTGSGKSTLISAVLAEILIKPDSHKFICTFESPIEYVYDTLEKPSSVIWQTEIGPSSDLPDFISGIRNAMRRAPDIIFTGESRDLETVEASLSAAQSGHAVYTTVHANSVVETFGRMVNLFPHEARTGVMNNLVNSVRLVVWQRLFVTPDGKSRIAVREYLRFTNDVREELLISGAESLEKMKIHMKKLVQTRGQSAIDSAKKHYDEGNLRHVDYLEICSNG